MAAPPGWGASSVVWILVGILAVIALLFYIVPKIAH